jgi:hypothetical protein
MPESVIITWTYRPSVSLGYTEVRASVGDRVAAIAVPDEDLHNVHKMAKVCRKLEAQLTHHA